MNANITVHIGDDKAIGWIQNHYGDKDITIQKIIFGHGGKAEVNLDFKTIEEWQKACDFFQVSEIKDFRENNN